MDVVNAVSKVRFATARPQRVHLAKGDSQLVELICLEAGQEVRVATGPWVYYVVAGTARLVCPDAEGTLGPGQLACLGATEPHTLANGGEARLICLALGTPV
jgi:mannose-6-phosphate isomerase-like protein (cupin superfamily)